MSELDPDSETEPLVCPYCRATFRPTESGSEGFEAHRCAPAPDPNGGDLDE